MNSSNYDIEDMEIFVDILNVFQTYYKNLYRKHEDETLFDGINYDDLTSTNRSMELLYDYIYEYRSNKMKDTKLTNLYDETELNMNDYEELYGLIIDGTIKKISPSFLALLIYLVQLEWNDIDWKISKLKDKN